MKKLLFSALLVLVFASAASAQCIPDGTYTSPGIYPDSATNLPIAYVNQPYSTVITVIVPADTTVLGFTLPIDSIGVTGWSGNPAGFNKTPNTASGYWHGGTTGCVLISSSVNPTISDTGTYNLVFNVNAYVGGAPGATSYTVSYYKIIIKEALSIPDNNLYEFSVMPNSPNPFSNSTRIEFSAPVSETYQFSVINVIGEEVYKKSINAEAGKNYFDFSSNGLPTGIYLYRLSNKHSSLTKRLIIEK